MQLAEVRQFPSRDQLGVAVLLHWLSRSTLELARHPSSCGLGAAVGWVGAPNFLLDRTFDEGSSFVLAVVLKTLH